MAKKQQYSGGTVFIERRALRLLIEAGTMGTFSSGQRVVLECGHLQTTDAVLKRGNVYSDFCDTCKDWRAIVRPATSRDIIGGRIETEEPELW